MRAATLSQSLSLPGSGKRHRIRAVLAWRKFKDSWQTFRGSPLAMIGLALLVIFGLMAIAHPLLLATVWPRGIYDPHVGFDGSTIHPTAPSSRHLLGTDSLGRDVLSMLLAATTPSFVLGLTAAASTATVGTAMGGLAGYYRGKVDAVLSRISDVFLLLPAPILMVIVGMRWRDLGPASLGTIYGLVAGAGGTAIVLRSVALQVRTLPFIEASRSAGGSSLHILLRHVLPHMLPMAALQMLVAVTGAVVADGFISFFGFTRSISNWGTIIYEAFAYTSALGQDRPQWHVLLPPSMALSLFALAFYLMSRGMHRVADPRAAQADAIAGRRGWLLRLKRRVLRSPSLQAPQPGSPASHREAFSLQPGEVARATVLIARLHDRSPSQATGERRAQMESQLFRGAIPMIGQYGGAVGPIGDRMLVAYFGLAPHRLPAQVGALLATHAGVELMAYGAAINERRRQAGVPELHLSVGIATGPIRSGDLGLDESRKLKGNVAMTAHRLQQFTEVLNTGGVFISDQTYQALHGVLDQFLFGRQGPASFPWDPQPRMVYEVSGRKSPLQEVDFAFQGFPQLGRSRFQDSSLSWLGPLHPSR